MKYDAFISYRHMEKDMFVAKGIHRALETAKIPVKIQKISGKRKIQRVFRDQEELPIGSDLGENIEAALQESEFLIVICSPQTKESVWVMKEIDTFISMHGRSNILAVLVEGDPEESFPEQILRDDYGNPVEPLAADVRGSDKKEISRKIKPESLRLAAAIIGCDYDDLRQRHRERMMRRYVAIAAACAVLGVGFGIYNAYSRAMIHENYRQMQINESKVIARTSADILEDGDRKTAALVAVEGLPHEGNDRPYVTDASYALSNALGSYKLGKSVSYKNVYEHKLAVKEFFANEAGTMMASYDEGQNIYIWDLVKGELSFYDRPEDSISMDEYFMQVAADDDHCYFVSHENFYALEPNGRQFYKIAFDGYCDRCAFSYDTEKFVLVFHDKVQVYNTADGKLLGEYPGLEEDDYFDEFIKFDDSKKKLAVSYHKTGAVYVIDLESSEQTRLTGEYGAITAMNFSVDGGFILATADFTGGYSQFKTAPMNVRKYDLGTGEILFDKEYEYDGSLNNPWFCGLGTREYTDSAGSNSEIIVTACKSLYTLDLKTGELINKYNSPQSEVTGVITLNNHNLYLASYDGMVYFMNASTGFIYSGYEFSAGDSIRKMSYGGQSFFTQEYYSPYIKEMTWVNDPSGEVVGNFEDKGYGEFFGSPEGNTYCMVFHSDDYNELVLYDALTDKQIDTEKIGAGDFRDTFYLDEDTIVIPTSYSTLWYYDVRNGDAKKVTFDEASETNYDRIINGNYMILKYASEILVIDLAKQEVLLSGSLRDILKDIGDEIGLYFQVEDIVITKDGKNLYVVLGSGDIVRINVETGQPEQIIKGNNAYDIVLSEDDAYLLLSCGDAKLKVFDIQAKEVINELEFYYSSNAVVQMSKDDRLIFLQGKDSYFRIYDLALNAYVFETDEQAARIERIEEDPDNNRLIMYTSGSLYIMDTESYGFTAMAQLGVFYSGKLGKILCYTYNPEYELYRFNIKSTEDLLNEVKERYGDAKLTESQKRKYKIG